MRSWMKGCLKKRWIEIDVCDLNASGRSKHSYIGIRVLKSEEKRGIKMTSTF